MTATLLPEELTDESAPAEPVPERPAGARLVTRLGTALWIASLVALAFVLWPTTLGGRTSMTIVSGTSMEPTYHTGDLALVRRGGEVAVGDVIVYQVPAGEPGEGRHVIHRVIGGDAVSGFVTRGDNRDTPDIWRPRTGDIVGTVRVIVPQGGTWALRALSPAGFGVAVTLLVAWALWPREDDDEPGPVPGAGAPTT